MSIVKLYFVPLMVLLSLNLKSQDLEPRAYANVPKGTNVAAIVYAYSSGNILSDPSKPITGAKLTSNNIGLGYVHTFGLAGKLARIQVIAPIVFLSGKAKINGIDTAAARSGFGDARLRFGINLLGSPALERKDFRDYKQGTIVGVSLVASIPTGLYHKNKLVNLGSNRWAIKPEIGVSRRFKRVYAEAYAGVWFYTKNTEYLTSKTLDQEPVFTFQGHISYYFKNNMWVGFNGNWFNGGATIVDNSPAGDLKDNWRIGAIWSIPIARQHSVKLQGHIGAFTSTGYDYNVVSVGYNYIF